MTKASSVEEREHSIVLVDVQHDRSKIIIHSFKPGLFPWQCPSAEDGFKVHPPSLDLVQVVQVFVKVSKAGLPERCLVSKSLKVGGVFEGLKKALVVSNLVNTRRVHVRFKRHKTLRVL